MDKECTWIYIGENDPGTVFNLLQEMDSIHLAGRSEEWKSGQALLTTLHPQLALLDLGEGEEGLKHLAKWSALFPGTLFFCTARAARPELIIRAMRAGAREFLLPEGEADEIYRAIASARRWLEGGSGRPAKAKLVCCFGVKGGMGTTTLAANLAVAAAHYSPLRVLLLDTKLQLGNAALFLDLQPRITLLQILENLATLDSARLHSTLARHSSGLYFIAGPENMEEADMITAEALGQIIELLRLEFDLIFIDSDDHFDEVTIRALDEADTIYAIAQLDVSTVYNLKRTLALFRRMGYEEDKVAVILNRYPQKMTDELASIEKSINRPIACRLPFQENGVLIESINVGEPIVLSRPRHPFSQQVMQLAKLVLPDQPVETTAASRSGPGLIKRWTRRKE
ncbi:MAG TPA: AAA family ATPase [bacterium]|nr:AAA family ATPase [bacterium]HPR86846.1 AAA family ATPase [bacterium]